MEQVSIRRLKPGTLQPYREAAEAKGRSLEAELRDVIERNRPRPAKDTERLLALSRKLRAGSAMTSDSTPYLRWSRDTNAGRLPGSPPFKEDDADR